MTVADCPPDRSPGSLKTEIVTNINKILKLSEEERKQLRERIYRTPVADLDGESQATLLAFEGIDYLEESAAPRLQAALGPKYSEFKLYRIGGTRACFSAQFGEDEWDGRTTRAVKVDIPAINERGRKHQQRGYNSLREAEAAIGFNHPNVRGLLDYGVLPDDEQITYVVEEFFPSQSLEERVQTSGPLGSEEFPRVFSQVLNGVEYLRTEKGRLHRDLKPSNILIDESLEARITDFANNTKIEELKAKYDPTAGGHLILHPRLANTSAQSEYDEQKEVYALATSMQFALTGKYLVEYQPEKGTGIRTDTGASLYADGMPDISKHNAAIQDGLKRLPRHAKRYERILRRALLEDTDPSKTYQNVTEFITDFREACKPTWGDRARKHWKGLTLTAAALIGMTAAAGAGYWNHLVEKEKEDIEKSKLVVTPRWNGSPPEIINNLVQLEVTAYLGKKYELGKYPDKKVLNAAPGDRIDIYAAANEISHGQSISPPHLEIVAYLEGFDAKSEGAWSTPVDRTKMSGEGSYGAHILYDIPKKLPSGKPLPEGTYVLAVDLQSYVARNASDYNHTLEGLNIPADKVLSRHRIPVVIGSKQTPVDVRSFSLDPMYAGSRATLRNPLRDYTDADEKVEWEVEVPGLVKYTTADPKFKDRHRADIPLDLEQSKKPQQHMMFITGRKDGDVVYATGFTIENHCEDRDYDAKFRTPWQQWQVKRGWLKPKIERRCEWQPAVPQRDHYKQFLQRNPRK